jgi:uncharacterized protein YvpB
MTSAVVRYNMLDVPTGVKRHTVARHTMAQRSRRAQRPGLVKGPHLALFQSAGLGLWPAFLLFVGLASIGLAAWVIVAQRSSPPAASSTRASNARADMSSLLLSVDATRDAQYVELLQLRAELETVRQTLATSDAAQRSQAKAPLALILDVPLLKQERSLSCESSAAAMAAMFYGLPVSESDILYALPDHENPNLGFRGNVDGPYGGTDDYGVHAEPIRRVLLGLGLEVEHLCGGIERVNCIHEIKQHIREGRPVIAWVTYRLQAQSPRQVTLSDGTIVTLVPYQHTVLVVGYNADGLWVHDPYDGTRALYAESDFLRSFASLGNMALAVGPPTTRRMP